MHACQVLQQCLQLSDEGIRAGVHEALLLSIHANMRSYASHLLGQLIDLQ